MFPFSNSLRGRGQVESRLGAAVPSLSRSVTYYGVRVGGGVLTVGARAGEATTLSRDWLSVAMSSGGMGERMDEWVCAVTMTSLHRVKQTVNSDKGDSGNKRKKANEVK